MNKMRNQLIAYVFGFIALLLIFIYLFQVVFLQDFYAESQKNNMVEISEGIVSKVEDDDLESYIVHQARANNVCIRVISLFDNEMTASSLVGCSLENLTIDEINNLISEAVDNGGSFMNENQQSILIKIDNVNPNAGSDHNVIINDVQNLTYTKVLEREENPPVIIMVNSQISPINSTVDTLQSQFVFIALIAVIVAVILAVALSNNFIKPLESIESEAKKLANGDYNGSDIRTNYEEAESLNETLTESSKMIRAADQAKRDLIANVSHDLRTPLTMITGYSEMMRDLPGENNKENAQIIIDESKRLNSLVSDLLDLSKLQDSKIELYKTDVSVRKLLNNVYKQYNSYCKQNNIDLELIINSNISIELDEKRISQVLYNFINNAINYGDKDDLSITIRQDIEDNYCIIEVIDNGPGIEETKLQLIWDRYYKINKEHIRAVSGSGIGLAISKEILELHDFEYGVESEVNKGSRFYFKIPMGENQ